MTSSPPTSGHYDKKINAEDDEDPVTKMLKKTGCLEINQNLQECMFEHRDWRKCQPLVQSLKECMDRYNSSKS